MINQIRVFLLEHGTAVATARTAATRRVGFDLCEDEYVKLK
jgi:hypothetical protein